MSSEQDSPDATPIPDTSCEEENPNNVQEETIPKWCVNCKWIATTGSRNWENYRCMAPQNEAGFNPVNGNKMYKIEFCKDTRGPTTILIENNTLIPQSCGPNAHWFVPCDPKPFDPATPLAPFDTFAPKDLDELASAAANRVEELRAKKRNKAKLSSSDLDNL